jgi:hypothetical protein
MDESQNSAALNSSQRTLLYQPGSIVRVTQQIAHRTHVYPITVKGKVLGQERQASGSWFARNRADRLWLDRLIIEKEDGEKVVLNLDEFTCVKVIQGPPPVEGVSPMISPARDRTGSLT